ncbi:MAG: type II toxin-antitoxin system HicB family antitoxin, partial [Chloroflexota bacterium]
RGGGHLAFVVRQAHHEREGNKPVRPELVEGSREAHVILSEAKKLRGLGTQALEYTAILHRNLEYQGYWVEVPALPGCVSQGKTKAKALENVKEAIELHLETNEGGRGGGAAGGVSQGSC